MQPNAASRKRPHAESTNDPLMLDDLPKVEGSELNELQRICAALMQSREGRFPGSQPVSFGRRHLGTLRTKPYYAAEKTDGVRYMLLILGSRGAFMLDRNFGARRLPPMHFPNRVRGEPPVDKTLLDGELVEDTTPEGPKLRYLVYDACAVGGELVAGAPLPKRLGRARLEVLAPRFAASTSSSRTHDFSGEPFAVELKDFYEIKHLPYIFKHVRPSQDKSKHLYVFKDPRRNLEHGTDGLIFTPINDPYVPGTCQSLLKWKPANMNSIDFKLNTKWRTEAGFVGPQPRFMLMAADRGVPVGYDWITLTPEQQRRFASDSQADGRIIECVYDPNHVTVMYNHLDEETTWDNPVQHRRGGWRIERVREDKHVPNDMRTVRSVWNSICESVSERELLRVV